MSQANASAKIILLSFAGNLLLSIGKLAAYLLSRSPSMLAETIHSFGDSFNQFLLYVGFRHGRIGPCHRYPMGHSRAQYVYNLLAAIGIFIGGLYTVYHGIEVLTHPSEEVGGSQLLSIIILIVSLLVEAYVLTSAVKDINSRRGQKSFIQYLKESDDPSIVAIVLEDGIAVIGAALALSGIWLSKVTGSHLPDIIASFMIATLLLVMAAYLFKVNFDLIVGPALPKPEQNSIKKFIEQQAEVNQIVHIQTEILGPSKIRLSIEVEFEGSLTANLLQLKKDEKKIESSQTSKILLETHDRAIRLLGPIIDELEEKLTKEFPSLVLIDIEPH